MATSPAFSKNKSAQLIAVMITSLLHGAFAVLIGLLCRVNYRSTSIVHKTLFGASVAMFIISSITLGLIIQELSSPVALVGNRQAQIILAVLQYVTGDLIIIWRVWVVWGHQYLVVVAPMIMLIVGAGFAFNLLRMGEGFYTVVPAILIVANTSICTLLIAGRIWYLHHRLSRSGNVGLANNHYKGIMFLVIESGALYTAAGVVGLVFNFTKSPALPIMLDLEIPLIGILPTLIIVQVLHRDIISGPTGSNNQSPSVLVHRSIRVTKDSLASSYRASPDDTDTIAMERDRHIKLQAPDYSKSHPPKREPNFYRDV